MVLTYEIEVDGIKLRETVKETIHEEYVFLIRTRQIGHRTIQKTKNFDENHQWREIAVNTTMSKAEVQQFELDWARMWTSRISEDRTPDFLIELAMVNFYALNFV